MFRRYLIAKKLILRGGQNLVLKQNFWFACKHQRRFLPPCYLTMIMILTEFLYTCATPERRKSKRDLVAVLPLAVLG
jgi:hypothetical protein